MRRMGPGLSLRHVLMGSLAGGVLAAAAPALAAGEKAIDIPAGALEQSLAALSAQTGDQLIYPLELVEGRPAPALAGRYTTEQALRRLIGAGAIEARRTAPRVVVLKPRKSGGGAAAPLAHSGPAGLPTPERPFGDDGAAAAPPPAPAAADPVAAPARRAPKTVEGVEVTGSHIRGGSPAAPLIAIDRAQLEATGHANVAAALQALPQTFGGEAAEGTVTTRADRLGTNSSYATSVNLRGLGADATLVLINGRRLAGSGNKGDFADLSNIPIMAVERIEVLLDGASALYGADAVGGVVNVILRRRFEGGEVRVRGGVGAGGTPIESGVGAVIGHIWESGSVMLAFEASRREALAAADRKFTRSADLRPLGGSDQRDTFSFPGNILRLDPATGLTAPYWAIPAGQPGTGLTPADFQANTVNRYSQTTGVDLLPDQRRQSAYLAWRQTLSPRIELSGDLRYGFRIAKLQGSGTISTLTVGPSNPFFVSPSGVSSHQIQYAFSAEGGNLRTRASAEALTASLGADADLGRGWRLQSYAAFAQEIVESRQEGAAHLLILNEALGNTPDNPATAYNPQRDGYFNPFSGEPGANSPAVLAAILSGAQHARNRSRVYTANAQADGDLFDGPGGQVKMALGAQARREVFSRVSSSYVSQPGFVAGKPAGGRRDVLSAYGELRAPLVDPERGRPGLRSLELSAALRGERYSDFGYTLNPRFGVLWSPIGGLVVRGTYGESFRAPALTELADQPTIASIVLNQGSARVRVLALQGGNPDLDPETAKSWTFGFEAHPAALPGARLSVNWFRTEFDGRIDRPLTSSRTTALTDPRLQVFVRRVSPATDPQDLALVNALLADPTSNVAPGTFPPSDVGAIIDQRWVNTAGLRVSGLDVQASVRFGLAGGAMTLGANASRLLDYKEAITPTDSFAELLGRVGYPAKFRARLTMDWTRDGLGLGAALNRLGAFHDPVAGRVGTQTTVDANARLTFGRGTAIGPVTATLNVRNLFNSDPPLYDNPFGYGYDAASADPIGRFISLQLTRSW
ncbi:MAG: TonB-dependent receptor [Phenylobacterium sp.]|uniref:TonB-dependent receptor n=1 Tax=Phenylobacterium sp. TaxID=1871053 RepID=UPI0025E9E0B0|nr:TonB-dependent receptor [Phenylobacterium sp.]MBI1198531.1 TonB-dependent receptor [Phenylobacterium sp.]